MRPRRPGSGRVRNFNASAGIAVPAEPTGSLLAAQRRAMLPIRAGRVAHCVAVPLSLHRAHAYGLVS